MLVFFKCFPSIKLSVNEQKLKIFKMSYYAVAKGRTTGIFTSWADCEAQVKGFSGARYKKFNSADEAQKFVETIGSSSYGPLRTSTKNNNRNYSLKRPHSTSSTFQYKASDPDEGDSNNSDDGDDLSTILTKQMDDIEKRLSSFEKGIKKIYNKNRSKLSGQAILIEPPQKRNRTYNREFDKDDDGFTIVYTDGACSSNGHQGARAGYGVYWGDGHPLNTCKPVSGRATNNCGEIQAATHAIKQAIQNGIKKLAINTDSQFLINSVTKWMPGWKRKGWKLKSGGPVKNEIDFKELDELQNQVQIKWNYVEAHRGIHGNEMADQLAREGAAMYKNK